ncbi:MAG: 3-dehydroquinate synthase [Duodenibacillus sp.]|nr:3-dehydroquinate synthase [Duodenibacillus sp.]
MRQVQIDLGERSYPIMIGEGALDLVGGTLARLAATGALVCTNATVGPLYAARCVEGIRRALPGARVEVVELPDGERYKDLAHVQMILEGAVRAELDRKGVMVALGGGVVGDMTGFAASMWMRGVRFVQVPTTLLAQVDSSVGGKTGVNLPAGKNLIGAFYQPQAVLADTQALRTLPGREVSAGLAEVIKYGFLGDAAFVDALERDVPAVLALEPEAVGRTVERCCRMKADIVSRDEREGGVRAKLNLGHTFGHAIEKIAGYGTWLHGEAVGAGLVMAAELSCVLGRLSAADVARVRALVRACRLPEDIPGIAAGEAFAAMAGDKKAVAGEARFVVMDAIGSCRVERVDRRAVEAAMRRCGWIV